MSDNLPAVQGVLAVQYHTEFIPLDDADPMKPGRITAAIVSEGWVLCSVTAGYVRRDGSVVVDILGTNKPRGRVRLAYAVATFCKPPEGWTIALVPKVAKFNDKPSHFHGAVTPNDSLWSWAQPTRAEGVT
jgi:hypothetical protein